MEPHLLNLQRNVRGKGLGRPTLPGLPFVKGTMFYSCRVETESGLYVLEISIVSFVCKIHFDIYVHSSMGYVLCAAGVAYAYRQNYVVRKFAFRVLIDKDNRKSCL